MLYTNQAIPSPADLVRSDEDVVFEGPAVQSFLDAAQLVIVPAPTRIVGYRIESDAPRVGAKLANALRREWYCQ